MSGVEVDLQRMPLDGVAAAGRRAIDALAERLDLDLADEDVVRAVLDTLEPFAAEVAHLAAVETVAQIVEQGGQGVRPLASREGSRWAAIASARKGSAPRGRRARCSGARTVAEERPDA